MLKEYLKNWETKKNNLEDHIRTHELHEYASYEDLVKLVVQHIINEDAKTSSDRYVTDEITVIDDGDYQGTLIIILHRDVYQPSPGDYIYTSVSYGSCSCCDTLMNILDYDYYKLPDDEQVSDLMTLCLHLFQGFHTMRWDDEED